MCLGKEKLEESCVQHWILSSWLMIRSFLNLLSLTMSPLLFKLPTFWSFEYLLMWLIIFEISKKRLS